MGTTTFIGGVTIGAGLVYLLDPEQGKIRRERLSQTLNRLLEEARYGFEGESEQAVVQAHRYGSRIGDIDGLGSATLPLNRSGQFPPGSSTALQVAGAVLALYGLTRRGRFATMLRTVGTGLLLGTVGRERLGLSGSSVDRRRAVDIQKTLHINAPIEQVYAFWTNYENFPLFMSNVRGVEDLGDGRSHWSISGPGGVPIEWDAVLTQQAAGEVIAWRSEPGSMLENAGMIRFSPAGTGTRVDLRLCYHPPAGGAGQAVAELLGSDPRAKLNEDLGRMKSLLEATTRSETHGKKSKS
ncbi:MAG TPA: SRPBCC family protein [Gemmatimonadales bacterium]|nr:SRPBCC family protein [Gemmatimonadales bacterium]